MELRWWSTSVNICEVDKLATAKMQIYIDQLLGVEWILLCQMEQVLQLRAPLPKTALALVESNVP